VSSNLINRIDSTNPIPETKSAKQNPTIATNGSFHDSDCPETKQTRAKGTNPIKKLINPDTAATRGNICGGT
jgi:hypothetical protein